MQNSYCVTLVKVLAHASLEKTPNGNCFNPGHQCVNLRVGQTYTLK
uniref:Uncharacterized protein n=1 Tax=Ciona intestinalis TaxID=7719 RepID=H2XYI0_CIOIN